MSFPLPAVIHASHNDSIAKTFAPDADSDLELEVSLTAGAKVMRRINLLTEAVLVDGSLGVVIAIAIAICT